MILTSLDFENNEVIPKEFTCEGRNSNPQLEIDEVPSGARSLVLIVDDPDAPAGTWTHWMMWNISPETKSIGQDEVPEGATVGVSDSGRQGYDGPCPPSGVIHHYHFRLFALDTTLDLPKDAEVSDLKAEMQGHIVGETEIVGLFSR